MLNLKTLTGAAVPVLMTLASIVGSVSIAQAQEASSQSRQFSARAGEIVLAARNHVLAEQHQAALTTLAQAITLTDITPYERAVIYQMQGSSYYQLGQLPFAITAFEQALGSGGLNAKEAADTRLKIAQLMIVAGRYAEGAQGLEITSRPAAKKRLNLQSSLPKLGYRRNSIRVLCLGLRNGLPPLTLKSGDILIS